MDVGGGVWVRRGAFIGVFGCMHRAYLIEIDTWPHSHTNTMLQQ